MLQISSILFDLDGTLLDTAPDLVKALNLLRQESRLPPLPLAKLRPVASSGVRGLLGAGLGLQPNDDDYDVHAKRFLALYEQHICDQTVPFSGINELLDHLDSERIAWGIVTNKRESFVHPLLDACGWSARAACVVSGDTAGAIKPSPEPLLHALKLAGMGAQSSLYLGDDLRDVQAGKAAGMITAVANWGYLGSEGNPALWGADWELNKPQEVICLLSSSGGQ